MGLRGPISLSVQKNMDQGSREPPPGLRLLTGNSVLLKNFHSLHGSVVSCGNFLDVFPHFNIYIYLVRPGCFEFFVRFVFSRIKRPRDRNKEIKRPLLQTQECAEEFKFLPRQTKKWWEV